MAFILIPPLVLAAGLVLIFFGAPAYFYRIAVARTGGWESEAGWLHTAAFETVSIRSQDGLVLRGRYVPAPSGGADTVILAHGYRGDGLQMGEYARFFQERFRCNVLVPDARGHGLSEGSYAGFGWHERLDWLRWIGWVRERTGGAAGEAPVRIVLFGLSMGAATVMMCAGEALPPEVKAVIEDCGYSSVAEELRYQAEQRYHISGPPGDWLLGATSRLTRKRARWSFEEASCVEQLKKAKVPVLFIHGDADTFVPFRMVFALYGACSTEKELYVVQGAGHGQAWETENAEYRRRVAGFLAKHCPFTGTGEGL